MGYIDTIMSDQKKKEDKFRAYFNECLRFVGLGQPPKGFFKKRCPLCGFGLNCESHFSPHGGFSIARWQCKNPDCDYVYAKMRSSD